LGPERRQQALPRYRARSTSPIGKSAKSAHNTSSATLRNNSGSTEPSALYTWADEVIGVEKLKRYRIERLSLDEIVEVERLADLVRTIRDSNPPGFYSAMRDKEVKGATLYFSATLRKEGRNYKPTSGMVSAWNSNVKVADFSTETLASAYDSHQIKLISARINRITETAVESDDEYVN
jgi:hypothetical protein